MDVEPEIERGGGWEGEREREREKGEGLYCDMSHMLVWTQALLPLGCVSLGGLEAL
jgi:hypothetical protein